MMHGATQATVSAATTSATSVPFATATANQVCSSPVSSHSLLLLVSALTFPASVSSINSFFYFNVPLNEKCMNARGSSLIFANYSEHPIL